MRVTVLGPVEAYEDDGTAIRVPGARPRMLLAKLALTAGESVSTGSLIDDLWYDDPPADAVNALHALVYRLRKALGDAGTLESAGTGYRLAVPAENVDAHRFEELAVRGRRELAAGAPQEAAASFGAALALWQGAALADVLDAPFATRTSARLEELRIDAVEDRFEAELRLGHHAEILADREAFSAEHPLRERLAALRMRALHAAGRQADALAVHEKLRHTLADELGVDPSAEAREAHLAVLRGGTGRPAARPESAPGRLPALLTTFIGREDELKLLAELMEASRLVTILGPGGVGKTRLAVEAASRHRAHRRGRLWLVPLAGVSGPGSVADAVLGVLSSPDGRLAGGGPGDPLDRVVELLGGGEAVLVLDNCEHVIEAAADFGRQLLERQPRLTVLATSRESLEVMGEALCRLGPLDLPRHRADPADAAGSAAVRLFVDRAAAVRPGFAAEPVHCGIRGERGAQAGRPAARPGAGRGAAAGDESRADRAAARRPVPVAVHGKQGGTAAPAHPARGDRVELGPADRAGKAAGTADVGVPRRSRCRRCGGGVLGCGGPAGRRRRLRARCAGREVHRGAGR
ncbi:BTAD domain-containing putative transcriptional regulator [Saccharopolyspora sp. NPDC050389]|uniref:AfsR/SARP family transcriptional regulator n=1 Tax=Saccharopolyspora sp. NPDC050389 TaxID=3155516 RepID=UPI0033ED4AE9